MQGQQGAAATEWDLDRIGGWRALQALSDAVLAAGEAALQWFRAHPDGAASTKVDRSPVTEADRQVEARLREFCLRRFPDVAVVGEEDGESGTPGATRRFIIDPIDGTRAFVRGLPTWSVLVGLEDAGVPVLGIAYLPAAGELYVAVQGLGATGNGRPLRVSSIDKLEASLICHGSLQQFNDTGWNAALPALAQRSYTQRGFADFDGYRQVLWGRAEAMIDPGVKPWDICAAAVLVREAGGTLSSMSGSATIYEGSCVASNGLVHDELVALLAAASA